MPGPVAGSLTLTPDGRSLVFRPGTLLAANTTYQVTIGGAVRSVGGRPLPAPAVAHFTTLNTTPPVAPAAGAVTATIPGDDGLSTVAGTQGTADPGGVVLVKNLTTGAITTLTPNADGSFSGRVAAAKADRLQLTLKDASGNATTVPIDPFRNADGSVIVGSAGGRVTGNGGTFADVPPGALPDGTVVKVEPLQAASFNLDAPAGFPFAAGLRVSLGGVTARREIHVGVQAPGCVGSDQVLVAAPVDFAGRRVWTVIDRAHLTGDKYASESPPFPGVTADGSYRIPARERRLRELRQRAVRLYAGVRAGGPRDAVLLPDDHLLPPGHDARDLRFRSTSRCSIPIPVRPSEPRRFLPRRRETTSCRRRTS